MQDRIYLTSACLALAVLLVGGVATAQERSLPGPFVKDPNPAPDTPGGTPTELIQDGSFEAGTPNPFWTEASTNFGTPLCSAGTCGTGGGTTGPNTGTWWAWFGGIVAFEQGSVEQTIQGNAGDTCTLTFWLWIGVPSGNGTDFVRFLIDSDNVFEALENTPGYGSYAPVSVDVSSSINGSPQTFRIESTITGSPDLSNFSVDDVSIECVAGTPTTPSWGMAILAVLILTSGLMILRRRRIV